MSIANVPLVLVTNEQVTIREYMDFWTKLSTAIAVAIEQGEEKKLETCLIEVRTKSKLTGEALETGVKYSFVNRAGSTPKVLEQKLLLCVMYQDIDQNWYFHYHDQAIKNWNKLSGPTIKQIGLLPYCRAI